ncbi:hypothetical protein O181_007187 [Austropuccinia psidii MF-1]|uniref:Uncharacterized protein n=1 Tax=Austropuccinia psidii MF-1 TaxID=1389203 RepID=A0A9Q3GI85_9BASI|nr:hypothetical protein [Austropuccinia psidii MF-1]
MPNEHLSTATSDKIPALKKLNTNYRSAIGSINYLSTATQPHLSFAVSTLPQYLESPGLTHWQAFLHVLKDFNGSQNKGLYYPRGKSNGVTAFSDADWGNCQVTHHPTTGYLACFHRCLIFWKTRKQPSISISTGEAEYKSLCNLTSEIMWFKQWCEETRLLMLRDPILIYEDNQACIKTANGDCNLNNKSLQHVDIQLHFIKEAIQRQIVCLCYIPSAHMLADFLKKSVNKETLEKSLQELFVLRLGERGMRKPPPKRV